VMIMQPKVIFLRAVTSRAAEQSWRQLCSAAPDLFFYGRNFFDNTTTKPDITRERFGETHTVDQAKEGNSPGWRLEAARAVSPRARDEAYLIKHNPGMVTVT
jgi:hypothetical protein